MASPANITQMYHALLSAAQVVSPPISLPGPGTRGCDARFAGRQAEPVQDVSHVPSVDKVNWSVVNLNQSAGGALSFQALISILLPPLCKNRATSIFATSFQLRLAAASTRVSLIFTSARLAAQISRRAAWGRSFSTNSRRKTVSRSERTCALESMALGKRIHSA